MSGKFFLILACAVMAQAGRRSVIPEPRQSLVKLDSLVAKSATTRLTYTPYAIANVNDGVYYQSANYPSAYPTNGESGLKVSSPTGSLINIYCSEFNVETSTNCAKDGMQLGLSGQADVSALGAYCGQGVLNATTSTNSLTIRFYSGTRVNTATVFKWRCLITAVAKTTTTSTVATTTTTLAPTTKATTIASATTVASTSTCSCGVRGSTATKIVNGTVAGIREFPWRCNLRYGKTGFFCGASIIDNSWILTAAHCTAAYSTNLYVSCGDYDISTETETASVLIPVSTVIQHPLYNKDTQDNDLSLLKLATPLTYSSSISPICLPWANQGNNCETAGTTITASGWGTTSSGGNTSNTLLKVDLPCIGSTACQQYYGTSVNSNMICTLKAGQDTCQGDSGGSIDYLNSNGRYYGIGVVSWGVGCADAKYPGVYAKVTNYLPWIQSSTNANFCKA